MYQSYVFVEVSSDTAVLDYFIKEFLVYKKFTDTLTHSKTDSTAWAGKISAIVKGKKCLYVIPKSKNSSIQFLRERITLNNKKSKIWEAFKKEVSLHKIEPGKGQ